MDHLPKLPGGKVAMIIVTTPVIAFLKQRLGANHALLRALHDPVLPDYRYPDGSVYMESEKLVREFIDVCVRHQFFASDIETNCWFRSLAPFPPRNYVFYYTMDYGKQLDEVGFIIIPGGFRDPSPGEWHLEELVITVVFRRTPSRNVLNALGHALRDWHNSMALKGLLEEGPARIISPELTCYGKRAQFTIDASQTGQNTLNWLVIRLFNFGYEVAPIAGVQFDAEEIVEQWWGPARGQKVRVCPIRGINPLCGSQIRFHPAWGTCD